MGILTYILYFFLLNMAFNWVYRLSPTLGIILYIGFIFYIFNRPMRRMFRTSTRPNTGSTYSNTYTQTDNTQSQQATFKKDPNVIDAEFTEHKVN